jgi:hypothetical protein
MAAAPVAALVAEADVTKAIVNTAVVTDVRAPVATVEPVTVIVVAPVAGGPESALVGSLHPSAGNPVVATSTPCPVAGGPEIAVAGSLGLLVVGQGRRRLICVCHRLSAVAGIVRALIIVLIGGLVVGATRVRRRSALLGGVRHGRRSA